MTKSISVLIVEDDKFIQGAYKIKFEDEGFVTKFAKDGIEAISVLKTFLPDVIVLDILMPKSDGFDFLKEVNKNKIWARIPVIVASNLDSDQTIKKAESFGVGEYVVKSSLSLTDLVNRIKEIRDVHI